jgi:hypothetical protein
VSRIDQGSIRFFGRTTRDLLEALHAGHRFPARRTGGQSLFFDKRNKLLRLGKLSKRGLRTTFVEEKRAREHTVGARVLPARPVYPVGGLTPSWDAGVRRGLERGMTSWWERIG